MMAEQVTKVLQKNISFPGNDGEELIRFEKMKRMVPVSIDESFPNI